MDNAMAGRGCFVTSAGAPPTPPAHDTLAVEPMTPCNSTFMAGRSGMHVNTVMTHEFCYRLVAVEKG